MKALFQQKSLYGIFGIGIALIVGAAVLLMFSQSDEKNAEHTVELRDSGFYPEEITIQKGETVKFTTTRDKYFWPASNIHPIHEIYPAFDPKEPIDPKETWSFRFDETGQWKYHDHLAPYYTGTVIVLN